MGSSNIQAKIKAGLAKAVAATGSENSELVFIVQKTKTGGGNDPINPPVFSEVDVLLKNAIFKSYDIRLINGSIKAGDRQLVADGDVEITEGAIIKQGTAKYVVINNGIAAPTSDVLNYVAQVRLQ